MPTHGGDQPALAEVPMNYYGEVIIRKAENGFIVQVGCKTFVAKTWAEASGGLANYFKDPTAARKKYCKD